MQSKVKVPNQYGKDLHPIPINAYFKYVSFSKTGYDMQTVALKQNANTLQLASNEILKNSTASFKLSISISGNTVCNNSSKSTPATVLIPKINVSIGITIEK